MVVELHPEDLEEKSLADFMAVSGLQPDVRHPLAMMFFQEALEEQNWQQGNCRQTAPRATDGRFRERAFELRPAREFVCSRTGVFAFAFLDAEVHHGTIGRGLPPFRQSLPRFPDQRGRDDREWRAARRHPYVSCAMEKPYNTCG